MDNKFPKEKHSSRESFWKFWWSCIWLSRKGAWLDFNDFTNLAVFLFALWLLVSAIWVGAKRFTEEQVNHWSIIVPAALLVITFGIRLVYAPYQKYKTLFEAKETDKAAHEARANKMAKDFEEAQERIAMAHAEHIKTLESQIEIQKKQIDDREARKKIKNALGDFLIELENRTHELSKVNVYQYKEEDQKLQGEQTEALLQKIILFLDVNLGRGITANFRNATDMIRTPEEDKDISSYFASQFRARNYLYDVHNHYIRQLKKIINSEPL